MAKLYFKVGSDVDKVIQLRQEIAKLKQELMSMDVNKAPAAAKALETQIGSASQEMRGLVSTAAQAGATMENDFKKKIFDSSKVVNTLSQKIIDQRVVIRDVEADVRKLSDAYRGMDKNTPKGNAALKELNSSKRVLQEEKNALFGLQTEQGNARLSVKKLKDEYDSFNLESKKTVESNNESSISFGKVMAAIGGVAALKRLGSEIIRVRGEFQSMQTAIETLVGKDMAGNLIPQIKELAKVSSLTLSDMVGAEKMMLGFNIKAEDTIRYLQALGDISMGDSQKFNSLTLAFSQMSATGKLMGQDLNQMINAGFNPLQQIAQSTGKSIATLKEEMSKGAISTEMVQKAFIDATSAGGKFFGMSENASKTINGQLSMMEDAMDASFNKIGTQSQNLIMTGIQGATSLIENYETIGKVLVGLIGTYGTYRTAVMAITAIHSLKASGIVALTAKEAIHYGWLVANEKAQKLLNATMLKNPYVLIATLVIGAAAAMWALHDGTTAAEKAQNSYNEKVEKAAKIEQEHKQKLEELISELQNEVTAETRKMKILDEIKRGYPQMFKFFIDEKGHVKDLTKAWKEYNEETSKKKARDNKQNVSSTKQNLKEYREMVALWEKYGEDPNFHKNDLSDNEKALASKYSNETLGKLKEKIESDERELWTWEKVVRDDELTKWKVDLKGKTDKQIAAIRSSLLAKAKASNGDRNLMIALGKRIKGIDDEQKSRVGGNKNYLNDYNKAKKEWEDAKIKLSEIEKDKSKFTTKQYKDANDLKEAAEKKYKDLGGSTGSALTKQEAAAEKLRKKQESIREQQDKNAQLDKKQSLDRQRQQQDLENQSAQAEIDALDDSFEKNDRQRKLNNKKEIQSLERQKEDYINACIQFEKEKFDAQEELNAKSVKNYNKKTFDSSAVNVDSSAYDGIVNNTYKRQLNEKIREQEDAWNEYLIKFGDYQEKRKAIIEKYDKQIEEAGNLGTKSSLEKEKYNAIDDLDNSIKNSATLMGQLFADASQKSANEIQKVIEKAELLMQYLESVKDEKGNAQIGGKTVSKKDILDLGVSDNTLNNLTTSTEEVEALRNAINKLKGDLGSKSPFELFKSQIKSAVDKLDQGGKKNIAQGITEIGGAISSFSPAISQFGQDLGNIFDSDDLGNKIAGISDALGGVGQTVSGVGQIMSGDIVGGAMAAVSGISSVVSAFEGLFGADYSHYNEMVEQYDTLNTIWDELIDKKKEYIDTSYGEEANKVGREALELAQKSIESYKILGKERLNAGASSGSHSIGVRIKKGMSNEGWDEAKKSLGWEFDKVTDGRMEGLFNLSIEQLNKLKSEAPTFWAKLDGDVRGYLDNIIQGEERLEDIQNQLKEQLTQVSFDSVFDSFTDTLMDMDSSAEDFSNNFEEYMQRAILTTMVGDKYKEKLKGWYDNFAKANDDKAGITKDELDKSQKEWDSIVADAVAERDKLKDVFGWTSSSDSQSQDSTSKGFETMPKDTGSELNGRFTALQMAGEEIKVQAIEQTSLLSSIDKKMSLMDIGKQDSIILPTDESPVINIRDILSNSYAQRDVHNAQLVGQFQILTIGLSEIKGIVNEMRTNQVVCWGNVSEITEGVVKIAKSNPDVVSLLNSIKDNTKDLS